MSKRRIALKLRPSPSWNQNGLLQEFVTIFEEHRNGPCSTHKTTFHVQLYMEIYAHTHRLAKSKNFREYSSNEIKGFCTTRERNIVTHLNVDQLSHVGSVWHLYGVGLLSRQSQWVGGLSRLVLQWHDAHPHKVAAVDPLITLSNHRLDALCMEQSTEFMYSPTETFHRFMYSGFLMPFLPNSEFI